MQIPTKSQFIVLASRFEQLHGIPYIIGAIDGFNIYLAPVVGVEDYYYMKYFI